MIPSLILAATMTAAAAGASPPQTPASRAAPTPTPAPAAAAPAASAASAAPAVPAASASASAANGSAGSAGNAENATAPATAAPAASPAPATRTKVAVLELSGLGINDIMKNLEQYLRNSIATIEGFQVLSAVDMQMALQDPKNRAVAQCGGGPECARQAGKLVGADIVIIGSISALGDSFALSLRALEVNKKKERARYQANVSGRDKLIPEVRLAAYRLVAPERIRGYLILEVAIDGVEVEVDGKVVGRTPLPGPVDNLKPGNHVVVIKRAGFKPFRQEFAIRAFEPTRITIKLEQARPTAGAAASPAAP